MVIATLHRGSIQPMSTGHITQGGGYSAAAWGPLRGACWQERDRPVTSPERAQAPLASGACAGRRAAGPASGSGRLLG
jgi:hypothetical protein